MVGIVGLQGFRIVGLLFRVRQDLMVRDSGDRDSIRGGTFRSILKAL